jgi:RimJ/RimL family protein N-acetyltransferase
MISTLENLGGLCRDRANRGNGEMTFARKISAAWRVFLQRPSAVLRSVLERTGATARKLITLDRLDVFVCTPGTILLPENRPDLEFRPLTSDDFEKMHPRTDRFGEQARLYYETRGINSAFGIFVDGELGHISWAYTAKEYALEPYERFRLGMGDAEIVNCFTADAYRGKGLYPHAVRIIAALLLTRGFDRVFMNIEPNNDASRHGILKAGLKSYGRVLHLRSPAMTRWRGCYRQQLY